MPRIIFRRKRKEKAKKKEETRKVLEEEQKEFEKAADYSAAEEPVLFKEEDFEREEKDEKWYKEFEKVLEETSDYVTEKQARGKIVVPQNGYGSRNEWYKQKPEAFINSYNSAEDYVMSDGNNAFENVIKGMFNNTRSTLGKTAGNAEFFLSDNIPGYKAGENTYKNNDPWYISDIAKKQFGFAREETGQFGNKVIDAADIFSKELGYGMLGLKSADWFRNADIGFTEYERLRKSGVSKEEAFRESVKKTGFSFAEDKFWDKGGDWLSKKSIKDHSFGIVTNIDEFVDNADFADYNRANKPGELINEFYDLLTDQEWAQYYRKIADNGMLNKPLGYIYVSYEGDMIIFSKRVMTGGVAQDYQIIDCWYIGNDEAYMDVLNLQKKINKGGNNYDERRIRQELDKISSKYD